ncbi:MAG: RNA polymerase sigma-I factor [Firmicutes bacterium]|nr:RNA polymerase sigma-I factor [Bacillota bacterium]
MVRLPFRRTPRAAPDSLETWLEQAQSGDAEARDQLLRSYLPFVDRVVSSVCGRAVGRTEDEFQIALVALNEAINVYQSQRGSFIGFAETVMKRRLIDTFRARTRMKEVPFTSFDEEDEEGHVQNAVESNTAMREHQVRVETEARAEEIARYGEELRRYGLSFQVLVDSSPKHADARENALDVARLIADDPGLLGHMQRTGQLPLKQLESRVSVSRKTLERQRQYILASTVLLAGDYEILQSFVRKEGAR